PFERCGSELCGRPFPTELAAAILFTHRPIERADYTASRCSLLAERSRHPGRSNNTTFTEDLGRFERAWRDSNARLPLPPARELPARQVTIPALSTRLDPRGWLKEIKCGKHLGCVTHSAPSRASARFSASRSPGLDARNSPWRRSRWKRQVSSAKRRRSTRPGSRLAGGSLRPGRTTRRGICTPPDNWCLRKAAAAACR